VIRVLNQRIGLKGPIQPRYFELQLEGHSWFRWMIRLSGQERGGLWAEAAFPEAGIGREMLGACPQVGACAPAPIPGAGSTTLSWWPSSATAPLGVLSFLPPDRTASVGEEIRLDVMVTTSRTLRRQLTVSYDPKVLEFRQAFEGEFLKREGTATS